MNCVCFCFFFVCFRKLPLCYVCTESLDSPYKVNICKSCNQRYHRHCGLKILIPKAGGVQFCCYCLMLRGVWKKWDSLTKQEDKLEWQQIIRTNLIKLDFQIKGIESRIETKTIQKEIPKMSPGIPVKVHIKSGNLKNINILCRKALKNYNQCWKVVIIDAPWPVASDNVQRGLQLKFPTMTKEDIYKLKLIDLQPLS